MSKKDIKNIKEDDLYSLLLYAVYKLTEDPKYSTLSELVYTVDRKSLLNLCSIFGGCTIKIPTLNELKMMTSALLIYSLITEGKTFEESFKETGLDLTYKTEVGKLYIHIKEILDGNK